MVCSYWLINSKKNQVIEIVIVTSKRGAEKRFPQVGGVGGAGGFGGINGEKRAVVRGWKARKQGSGSAPRPAFAA
jgi:hypothetical protein